MRLEKAQESLASAQLCHFHGNHNSSVSRSYYAVFQAAIVALEAAGIRTKGDRWSHAGLKATFASELIRRQKLYPADFAIHLHDLLDRRLQADYDAADVSATIAARSLAKARKVVDKVAEVVRA
ncbi:MAG TPA: HEPN domain-containing protein [Candidatus Xenobia bacterium]|jgi:uncharacterized protein (UPF0332 family)